jgi:hypothetical protein
MRSPVAVALTAALRSRSVEIIAPAVQAMAGLIALYLLTAEGERPTRDVMRRPPTLTEAAPRQRQAMLAKPPHTGPLTARHRSAGQGGQRPRLPA